MRLQWTHRAWVERLRARARRAAQMPWAGRVVPELGRDDIQEVSLRAYRIVYRVRKHYGRAERLRGTPVDAG